MTDVLDPPAPLIVAANRWRTNADMILTARDLGYIRGRVLDPTYGRGKWWAKWRPELLVAHDLKLDGVDFRNLPDDGRFDTITFDPPYIPQGGRTTSTVADFTDRYGLDDVPKTTDQLLRLIVHGMAGFRAHLTPGGILLVKCMGYVSSGRYNPMPRWIANAADQLGYRQLDELVHIRHALGPQPIRAHQLHARRNYSMLLVFGWPARPPAIGETATPVDDAIRTWVPR